MARLDRLARVKETAQIGACIGREFSYELLAVVSPLGDNELQEALQQLVNSELVFRRGAPPDATYAFKHALVQDAAYRSLLKSKSRQLHLRIGQALEKIMPTIAENEPEIVAHHFRHAEQFDKAIHYLDLANLKAIRSTSPEEAVQHFSDAMELLDDAADNDENRRMRVNLIVRNGTVFQLLFRFPEYFELLNKFQPVAEQLGDAGLLGALLARKGHLEWAVGALDQGIETETEAAILCEKTNNNADAGYAHMVLAWIDLLRGRFKETLSHRDRAIFHLEKESDLRWHAWSLAGSCLANLFAGNWDDAVEDGEKELALAEKYSDDSLISFALWILSYVHGSRGDWYRAIDCGRRAVDVAPTPADAIWAVGRLGWALGISGRIEEGIAMCQELVSANRAGDFVWSEMDALQLAELQIFDGRFEDAQETLSMAVPYLENNKMLIGSGIAERLLAQLGWRSEWRLLPQEEGLQHIQTSLKILSMIGAQNERSHSQVVLGFILAGGGKSQAAKDALTDAFEMFESLGTKTDWGHLKEARALLERL